MSSKKDGGDPVTRCLITGGRGFFGSHLVEHLLKNTDWEIVVFDKLSYASVSEDRLTRMDTWQKYKNRVSLFTIDLCQWVSEGVNRDVGEIDYIFHAAAESHVDKSIENPVSFVLNNVAATLNILEYARCQSNLKMFFNISTDEVFGPAPQGYSFKEFEAHKPSNPYSASKSAQESIGIAYSNTYKVPVVTVRSMNLIGERQHPEKFVPKIVNALLQKTYLTIHGDANFEKIGTRFYLHCRNLADALLHIVKLGYTGYDEWNISGLEEISNLDLALRIANILEKPLWYGIVDFHSSRPGHDLRYALDSSKLLKSGYVYPVNFEESLARTVKWMVRDMQNAVQ
jgi:dTDP-glucose 4,6-dehydratase